MIFSLKKRLHSLVLNAWFGNACWTRLLLPLSVIYSAIANRRKARLLNGERWEPPVPIVVVGNITVGGTGKTPVVASLVQALQAKGYRPGIVSRGFGVKGTEFPVLVTCHSNPGLVGDEPVMLAHQLNVPIAVDPDRVSAAKLLCEQHNCNLIIADDGLQHYNLKRHVEILVIDGMRMLGNGYCLPAGPLREGANRLDTVDVVLTNGEPAAALGCSYTDFNLLPQPLAMVTPGANVSIDDIPREGTVHGVAGIGNPERFFNTLAALGFDVIPHSFPDHHGFRIEDISFDDGLPVIMTAKDAVKCTGFAQANHWYLPVVADIPAKVLDKITSQIDESFRIENG